MSGVSIVPTATSTITQTVTDFETTTEIFTMGTTIAVTDVIGEAETFTVTVTQTSTATVTNSGNVNFNKRYADVAPVCPVVNSALAVPTYASACTGTARYSSACSCFGVTAMTVTASQPTSTVTVTFNAEVTPPTVFVTTVVTELSSTTTIQLTFFTSTATETVTKITESVFVTTTSSVTVTTTASGCSTYAPYATNGAFAGHALGRSLAGVFTFQDGMDNPQLLYLQGDGTVRNPARPSDLVAVRNSNKSVLIFIDSTTSDPWTPLSCRVSNPLNQSGALPLICTTLFETCDGDATLYAVKTVTSGCTEVNLGVFKACNP